MRFNIGDVIQVGNFFWISDDDFIGYNSDAKHGHGLDESSPGSVDTDCSVRVVGRVDDSIVVSLIRPILPYGAPAAIGTVFKIDADVLLGWEVKRRAAEMLAREALARMSKREALARLFCK